VNAYRERQLRHARAQLVEAARQISWALEREDSEAALRCAFAAGKAKKAGSHLVLAARALDRTLADKL
jgi:hypothetical protein